MVQMSTSQSTVVFPMGSPIPSVKELTFCKLEAFSVDVVYVDAAQRPPKICTYMLGPFQPAKGEHAKIKLRVRLNLHGIVSAESATLLEEEEVEVAVVAPVKESSKETNVSGDPVATGDSDVNMQENRARNDASGPGAGNDDPGSSDKPLQMDTDKKADNVKKKVKRTNVPMSEMVYGGMAAVDVQMAVEKEFEMDLQDKFMEDTKEKKNAVEAYVYDMRNKLHEKYQEFVSDSEREEFSAKLQEVEDWLYEDGEDESKGVYMAKLEELKKQGDPIEERYKESLDRGPMVEELLIALTASERQPLSKDRKFDHIDVNDKQKIVKECGEAEVWLRDKTQQQDGLPKYAPPVLLTADMKRKAETLDRFCRPIMTKPKAAPSKPQTATETPQQPSEWQRQATESSEGQVPEGGRRTPLDPMDIDKKTQD